MKKIIAYLLVAMMAISSLAACGGNEEKNTDLQAAVDYVYAMYKDLGNTTANDFERTAQVMIGTTKYVVEWTANSDKVTVTVDGAVAKIDIDEKAKEALSYELTATVKDDKGNSASKTFKYTVPAYEGFGPIVDALYALEDGQVLNDGAEYIIEGKVIAINTGAADGKITVTIVTEDRPDKPIQCYNLKPGAVADVSGVDVGDVISAKGQLKNYKGTYEFNGCTLEARTANTDVKIYDSADALLAVVEKLPVGYGVAGVQTITGTVSKITSAYTDQYKNMNLIIKVGEREVTCYRLVGDAAKDIKEGDTITVSGNIMRYKENVLEFVQGCKLVSIAGGNGGASEPEKPADTDLDVPAGATQAQIVDLAFKLVSGKKLTSEVTLTGEITNIKNAPAASTYTEGYWEACLTIKVEGKDIYCYWVKGTEAQMKDLKVGDTLTVKGTIKNYNDLVEFDKPYVQ